MYVTSAETLFIERRRLGVSQAKRASVLLLSEYLYLEYEQNKRKVPKDLRVKLRPTKLEKCVIRRRREGWTQEEVANDIGCSRLWVIKMEDGSANPALLFDYWS